MSAALSRLTKAQLIARINEVEREVNALHVAQRPSRQQQRQWPIGQAPRDVVIERRGQCTIKRYAAPHSRS